MSIQPARGRTTTGYISIESILRVDYVFANISGIFEAASSRAKFALDIHRIIIVRVREGVGAVGTARGVR